MPGQTTVPETVAAAPPASPGWLAGGRLSAALALLTLLAVVALRAPFLNGDLLKSDEAVYAISARAWSEGLLPGRDLWDSKPPGMAALYRLAGHLPGGAIGGSRLLALLATVITLLVALRLARLVAPALAPWPVGLAYVLLTHANGWHPAEWVVLNGELPATALVALSTLCLAEWARRPGSGRPSLLLLAGAGGGLALLFRQTALIPVLVLGLWLAWAAARRGGGRAAWSAVGLAAAGIALAWLPLVGYYRAQGAVTFLWAAWGGCGLAYAGQRVGWEEGWHNARASLGVGMFPALVGLGLLGTVFALARVRSPRAAADPAAHALLMLMIAFGLGSALAVLPGGHLFEHYFLQAGPAWALAAGLGLAHLARLPGSPVIRTTAAVLLALGVVALLGRLALTPAAAQRTAFREANREVFDAVAADIRTHTQPTDRVLVWAWAPQLYWYAARLPATRDLTLNYALGWIGRQPQELFPGARAALLSDLRRTRPPLFVVPSDTVLPFSGAAAWRPETAPEVWAFLRGHYRLARRVAHWDVYELRAPRGPAAPQRHSPEARS